eukprot:761030-Hanusia_phi.AAC.3
MNPPEPLTSEEDEDDRYLGYHRSASRPMLKQGLDGSYDLEGSVSTEPLVCCCACSPQPDTRRSQRMLRKYPVSFAGSRRRTPRL